MKRRYVTFVFVLLLGALAGRAAAHVDETTTPTPEEVSPASIIIDGGPRGGHVPGVCAANDTCDDCFSNCQDDFEWCTRGCHPEDSATIYRECEHRCGITEWDCLTDASSTCTE